MKRLYLLGFTHDLKGVALGLRRNAKMATMWLPVDETLLAALERLERTRRERSQGKREDSGRGQSGSRELVAGAEELDARGRERRGEAGRLLPPVGRSPAGTGMRPSEIQQLLREGRSINAVAEAAKTNRAWVERLAEPVIAERLGVVQMAQGAVMPRPRLGPSGLALGEAVRRNLEERRATVETIERLPEMWDARLGAGGAWRVILRFNHRGKRRTAEWEFQKGRRQILPRNRLAAQLGWWPPEAAAEPERPLEDVDESDEGTEEAGASPPRRRTRRTPRARRAPVRGARRQPKRSGGRGVVRRPRARRPRT